MVVGILCGWFGVWVVAGGLRALRSVFGLLLLLCLVAVSVVLWVWAVLWICGLGCWLVVLLGCWVGRDVLLWWAFYGWCLRFRWCLNLVVMFAVMGGLVGCLLAC